jgi:hypothetical protein
MTPDKSIVANVNPKGKVIKKPSDFGIGLDLEKTIKKKPTYSVFKTEVKPQETSQAQKGGSSTIQILKPQEQQLKRKRRNENISQTDFEILGNYEYYPANQGPNAFTKTNFAERTSQSSGSLVFNLVNSKSSQSSKLGQLLNEKLGQTQKDRFANTNKYNSISRIISGLKYNEKSGFNFIQSPKQSGKQTPSYSSITSQIFGQLPKQGTTSKQTSQQLLKTPTPQRPRTSQRQTPTPTPYQPLLTREKIPPKLKNQFKIVFGTKPPKGKHAKHQGPTGIENLDVRNIFSSSLSITIAKGKRFEF